jgi:hypothetical protein
VTAGRFRPLGQAPRAPEPVEQSLEKVFGPVRKVSAVLVLLAGAIVTYAFVHAERPHGSSP